MAGQARESQVFFRIQAKAAPRSDVEPISRPDPIPRPSPISADGDLTTLSALRAAERARALANGDLDALAGDGGADQARKLTFLKSGPEKDIYNPHALQKPASPYQLMAGTIIAASMVSGLNSDLPGFVIAQVTEHVYDSVSGRFLLIPQGSRLLGRYDNIVAFGQERALVDLAAHHPARRQLGGDRQPACHRYRRLCRPRRSGRSAHLEAAERRGTLNRTRRWQSAGFRVLRQRPRQGAAAVDAVHHQSRRPAPSRDATSMCSRPSPCGRVGRCA